MVDCLPGTAYLDRNIRPAEGVPPRRMQYIRALHAQRSGDDDGSGIGATGDPAAFGAKLSDAGRLMLDACWN